MASSTNAEPLTEWLRAWQAQPGGPRMDARVMEAVYGELRRLAAQRLAGESRSALTPTELVHETWVRLKPPHAPIADRNAFLRLASVAMRNLLVDQARDRLAGKRGGAHKAVTLSLLSDESSQAYDDTRMLDLDRALAALGAEHPRHAEAIVLRAFGGLALDEVAAALGISLATVKRDLAFARAWLLQALNGADA